MPNTYVLEKMMDDPKKRDPQTMQMAVGSSFDYFVKKYIAEKKGIDLKDKLLKGMFSEEDREKYKDDTGEQILWKQNVEPQNRKEAAPAGLYLFTQYLEAGLLKDPAFFRDVEIRRNFTLLNYNVPLFGILDAEYYVKHDDAIPFDWKISGYGSDSGASPKKFYVNSWSEGKELGPHKEYVKDVPFHHIDEGWATQGCTYGWMMGKPVGIPFEFMIDMFAIRPKSVKVARYLGVITKEFQESVALRYFKAWEEVKTGSIFKRVGCTRLWMEILAANERWY
jgi:hypothetical protein